MTCKAKTIILQPKICTVVNGIKNQDIVRHSVFLVCTTKAFSLDTPFVVSNKENNIQGTTLDFLNMRKRGIKQIELKVIPFKSQNFKSDRFRSTPSPLSPSPRH